MYSFYSFEETNYESHPIFRLLKDGKPVFEEKRKKAALEASFKRKTGKIVKCETCGNPVYKTKYRLQHSSHNFCSYKCHESLYK